MAFQISNQSACCCGKSDDSIVQIGIGDDTIGLVGLNQVFEQLNALNRPVDTSVEDELLLMVGAKDYIPAIAEAEYREALLREYARYCNRKAKSK